MSNNLHETHTFIDTALAFSERHPKIKDTPQGALGAALFGMMKALAECPECPGAFRIPHDSDWTPNLLGEWKYLACPQCQRVWTHNDTPKPEPKTKRKRKIT